MNKLVSVNLITMQPSKYDDIKEEMSRFVVTIIEDKDLKDPLGFALLRNSLLGESYKIFLSSANEELEKFLYVHECGHIIFGHVENTATKSSILSNRIKAAYSKHPTLFSTFSDFFEYVKRYMYNVAMDLEVNSKSFSEDDIIYFDKILSAFLSIDAKACYPKDYNYPLSRGWREYLQLILDDIDKFIEEDKKRKGAKSDAEYSAMIKKDVENELLQNKESKADEIEQKSIGRGGGKVEEARLNKLLSFDSVKKDIMKSVFHLTPTENRRDMMYNFNRRKSNSSVLIPKTLQWNEFRQQAFYVIFDISGSVDDNLIDKCYSMFYEIASIVGKRSRIIFCDHQVEGDFLIRDRKFIKSGGGTDIARGIEYVRQKYDYSNSVVFIMSDFYDYLDKWEYQLKRMKTKLIYGICWDKNADFSFIKKYFKNVWLVQD